MALLEIRNLTHHFGGLCAVNDFNLELRAGELVALIGPNGAGKTTVFNLVTGVYRPGAGSIRLDGRELVGRRPHKITALGIARTFQNIRLFKELTVLENIMIAHYADMKCTPIEALLHIGRYHAQERRVLEESMTMLERFKLDGAAFETARGLPYGQQRRLEIARALSTRPRVLLLDEPAAGMNPNEIGSLMDFIGWLRVEFGVTILVIEHQMKLVMGICERIKVLDFGATIAEGTPAEIVGNRKVLEAYLGEEVAE